MTSDLELVEVDPLDGDAVASVTAYFAELQERFPGGFLGPEAVPEGAEGMRRPTGTFVVARIEGRTVGCGGLQTIGPAVGEIKRMWVDRSARGTGVASRLLARLEDDARELGHDLVRLDTNEHLPEAIALYEAKGYGRIERYNDNPYPTHFYEKRLG